MYCSGLLYGSPGFESRNAQHLSLGLADKNFGFFPFFAAAGNKQSRAEPVTSTKKNNVPILPIRKQHISCAITENTV
jgi:hypothetical protein